MEKEKKAATLYYYKAGHLSLSFMMAYFQLHFKAL